MRMKPIPAVLKIDGLRIVNLSIDESLDAIASALEQESDFFRIGFVNADCLNIATNDASYKACLHGFDWIFADGSGMRLAGRIMGQPIRDNVNGTDLFPLLCTLAAQRGHSIYLLGGNPGVAEAAADWAKIYAPGLRVAGFHHGYIDEQMLEAVKQNIRLSGADMLLVGLGAPIQEKWISAHAEFTGVRVALGVGGLFDYYSGRIPRAPLWVRRLGCEWIFRMMQEPGRLWRRYLIGNPVFVWRIFCLWGLSKKGSNS